MSLSVHDSPPPFNENARPGLGKAVLKAYAEWCEEHINATQDERKAAYAMLYIRLRSLYPSYKEMKGTK